MAQESTIDASKLLDLKEKIEEAKTEISELNGSKKQLLQELSTKWKCSSIKEAEKAVQTMTKVIEELTASLETGIEKLEEQYDFENEEFKTD